MTERLEHAHDFRWGLERETHRILQDGSLSPFLHPESLKAPSFTKDFAESQLEFVTAPHSSITGAVGELGELTHIARHAVGTELLWPFSMPPIVDPATPVMTARMGNDEGARLGERYRAGLSARYGVTRQLMCGVHLNVSIGDSLFAELRERAPLTSEELSASGTGRPDPVRDAYYLRLVRNLFEDMPVLVMLFGATPFDANAKDTTGTYAYSVRNSLLGYARTEYRPFLDLSSIDGHLAGIRRGMNTESITFRNLGLVRDGKPIQLNNRVFQKDKEFYAPIRFKRIPSKGESTLGALQRKGVEYIELRFMDIDPFTPAGVSEDALRIAQLFILDALMRPSNLRSVTGVGETLRRADAAALSDPFGSAAENVHLAALVQRLTTLTQLARHMGLGYEEALAAHIRRFSLSGGAPAAVLAKDFAENFAESGLDWSDYGAMIAQTATCTIGECHGITA